MKIRRIRIKLLYRRVFLGVSGILLLLILAGSFLFQAATLYRSIQDEAERRGRIEAHWFSLKTEVLSDILRTRAGWKPWDYPASSSLQAWNTVSEDIQWLCNESSLARLSGIHPDYGRGLLTLQTAWIELQDDLMIIFSSPSRKDLRDSGPAGREEYWQEVPLFERKLTGTLSRLSGIVAQQHRVLIVQGVGLLSLVAVLGVLLFAFLYNLYRNEVHRIGVSNLSRALIRAQEQERKAVALDLHDVVAQQLAQAKLLYAEARYDDMTSVLDGALKSVRNMSYQLRPPDLENRDLIQAVQNLSAEIFPGQQPEVSIRAFGIEHLDLSYDTLIHIYRLIQEALFNIRKHADARRVQITLTASYPVIIIQIADDGRGFGSTTYNNTEKSERHMGILGMKQRAALLGGTLSILSKERKGTKVRLEIPVVEEMNNG